MAKFLILAALLFFSFKTGVSSIGTTTSPQQHNPQTGAEKDPCEVLLSMLYTTKSYVLHEAFICHDSVYHYVYQAKRKTNPSPITSSQRQNRTLLFLLGIYLQRYEIIQCSELFLRH